MIAANKNKAVSFEDRTYPCNVCGCDFAVRRGLNAYGDVVGGDHDASRPQKCSRCRGKRRGESLRLHQPGETVTYECSVCEHEFSFTWKGKRRSRCERCIKDAQKKPSDRVCKVCGKSIDSRQWFCSTDCRAARQAELRTKLGKSPCVDCKKPTLGLRCRSCFLKAERTAVVDRIDKAAVITSFTATSRTGRAGEAYFDLVGAMHGWRVFSPNGECTPGVDRVVLVDDKAIKVQIKSTKEIKSPRFKPAKIKQSDAEWLAVVAIDSLNMWIVDANETPIDLSASRPWSMLGDECGTLPQTGRGAG